MAKARKLKMRLWALAAIDGGFVYSGNIPSLYDKREEAWYDGDDETVPVQVEIEVREIVRKK